MTNKTTIMDFYGIPGSGKTTKSHLLAGEYRKAGKTVIEPSYNYDHGCSSILRRIKKVSIAITFRFMHPYRYSYLKSLVKLNGYVINNGYYSQIVNVITKIHAIEKYSGQYDYIIFDEGIAQTAISLSVNSDIPCADNFYMLMKAIRSKSMLRLFDIRLNISEAMERIRMRNSGDTRVEKLKTETEKIALMKRYEKSVKEISVTVPKELNCFAMNDGYRNKTLLFYINTISGGGAARVIIQVAHHFADEGYKSILVTSFVDKNYEYTVPENVQRLTIEQEEIKQSKIMRNISRVLALRRLCHIYKPVALISFMAEPNFRSIIATLGLPIKNIVSVRNDPNREYGGFIGRFIGKHIITHADGCVFQTEEAKAWFSKAFQEKSTIIFNEIKKEFFETERKEWKNIVAVGRLSKQKNHELLIRAYARIAEHFSDIKLQIYGSGVLKEHLNEVIKSLDMKNHIELCDATDDVLEVLKHARLFVLSSDYEGMPNCLMEALAVGVPSISTDCPCGGPRTLIENGYSGILVPIKDEIKMSEAIEQMLYNENYAAIMGKNAKQKAEMFQPDIVFLKWKLYVEGIIS